MITRIWDGLFIGDARASERLADHNPLGINAVITLCPEPIQVKNPGIDYIHAPMPDGVVEPEILESILDTIAVQIRKGALLLNCTAGFSRSPCMAAMWMHVVGYGSFDMALREISHLRPVVDPSPGLVNSVKEYLLLRATHWRRPDMG